MSPLGKSDHVKMEIEVMCEVEKGSGDHTRKGEGIVKKIVELKRFLVKLERHGEGGRNATEI